jgi:hypothetical protein
MNSTPLKFILLCGLAASATTLHAQQPYIFEDLDRNQNGAISMGEAKVRKDLVENFREIDSDGSGTLSIDEYSSYMNKGTAPEDMEIPEPGAAPVM